MRESAVEFKSLFMIVKCVDQRASQFYGLVCRYDRVRDTDSMFYLNVWFESEAIADSRRDECNRMVMNMLCSICFF